MDQSINQMGSCVLIGVNVKIWDTSLKETEVFFCLEREELLEMLKNFRTPVPCLPVRDCVPLEKSLSPISVSPLNQDTILRHLKFPLVQTIAKPSKNKSWNCIFLLQYILLI